MDIRDFNGNKVNIETVEIEEQNLAKLLKIYSRVV